MKRVKTTLLLITLSLCSSIALAEVAVIVNPANGASVSNTDISAIFLGKSKKFSDGSPATPVVTAGATADEFNTKALGKTSSQLKSYWSKLVFTGKANPPKSASAAEVLGLVKSNGNMIGFIDAASVTADVKVVATF